MKHIYEDRAYTEAPRAQCGWEIARDWPPLDGDASAEIAIIGAGYTGLNAALTLAQAGQRPVVLDAREPGWGASGRNGGFCCLGGTGLSPEALARRFGEAAAREVLDAERAAIDHVRARLDAHGIDAQTHSDGEVVMAHRARALRELEDEAAGYARHGIETALWDADDLAARGLRAAGIHGGLHVKAGFALDPGAYATGLARAAQAAGAVIHGQSPVTRIARIDGVHHLSTPRGVLRAKKILIATNGYSADDLPRWLRGRYLPVQSSVLMTRPLTHDERAAQGWTSDLMAYDTRRLLHYFRLLPDGRFLFGMRGGIRATERAEARAGARMIRQFHDMFPAWRGIEIAHQWSGLLAFTARFVPHVGPVDGDDSALVAMGYHGNGVAMGSYAGDLAGRLLMGEDARPAVLKAPMGRFPLPRLRRNGLRLAYPFQALRDAL